MGAEFRTIAASTLCKADVALAPAASANDARIHWGYQHAVLKASSAVKAVLAACVQQARSSSGGAGQLKLHVTGHSYGGALASLFAHIIKLECVSNLDHMHKCHPPLLCFNGLVTVRA